jgi:hypothetical protein
MFLFTTSTIGREAGVLPRWFALIGYAVGLFLLLSATFTPILILVFPTWLLTLAGIMLLKARTIPREVRLPAGSGAGVFGPFMTREDPQFRPPPPTE